MVSTPSQFRANVFLAHPELGAELMRRRFPGLQQVPSRQEHGPARIDHPQKTAELSSSESIDTSGSLALLKYYGIAIGGLILLWGLWLILPVAFPLMRGFFIFFGRDPVLIGLATFLQIALAFLGGVAFVMRKMKDKP